jgi:hypothetical protein
MKTDWRSVRVTPQYSDELKIIGPDGREYTNDDLDILCDVLNQMTEELEHCRKFKELALRFVTKCTEAPDMDVRN